MRDIEAFGFTKTKNQRDFENYKPQNIKELKISHSNKNYNSQKSQYITFVKSSIWRWKRLGIKIEVSAFSIHHIPSSDIEFFFNGDLYKKPFITLYHPYCNRKNSILNIFKALQMKHQLQIKKQKGLKAMRLLERKTLLKVEIWVLKLRSV